MYKGQSTQQLSWATVEFTVQCELKVPGGRQPREDAITDDVLLAAGAALTSQSYRFNSARQNGEHPDKRTLSDKFGDDALTVELQATFDLKKSVTQDTLRAMMLQTIIPAASIAAGSHFSSSKQQGGQPAIIRTLGDIEDLVGPRSGSTRRAHAH